MKSSTIAVLMGLVFFFAISFSSYGDVPQMINYQGKLTTPEGALIDTVISMTFAIFPDSIGLDTLWSEIQDSVSVENGSFSVLLGSAAPISHGVFSGEVRYLGMKVGDDPEMTPRKEIASAPYAFRTATLDGATGGDVYGDLHLHSTYTVGDVGDAGRIIVNDGAGATVIDANGGATGYTPMLRINSSEGRAAELVNSGETNRFTLSVSNTTGTAGQFQSGDGYPGYPGTPVAVYGIAFGDNNGGSFSAEGNGHALIGKSMGTGRAIYGSAYGTGYSGYFIGGQGVHVQGNLNVALTAQMTSFKMPTGASAGHVLTSNADGKGTWQAPVGEGDNDWEFRVTDGADTTLITKGEWGIARTGNTLYGNADSTHVNLGVASITGLAGENHKYCTVGGGKSNAATGGSSTVGGGWSNTASAVNGATVGGGWLNSASANWATVGGGHNDTASGTGATVGGGLHNIATGDHATVGGGAGNTTGGDLSVIPGGWMDTLTSSADYSMVFGRGVYVNSSSRVVFFDGDYSGRFGINRDDRDGGISYPIHVGTATWDGNGAYLTGGGVWTDASSREVKENFQKINGSEILDKLQTMSICRWQYKGTDEHHIGPVAEDFYDAFAVGTDNKYLSSSDLGGVALRAIQELVLMLEAQQKEIEVLEKKIAELER